MFGVLFAYVTEPAPLSQLGAVAKVETSFENETAELPFLRICQSLTSERKTERARDRKCITQQYLYVGKDGLFLYHFFIMKVYELKLFVWLIPAVFEVFGDTGKVW